MLRDVLCDDCRPTLDLTPDLPGDPLRLLPAESYYETFKQFCPLCRARIMAELRRGLVEVTAALEEDARSVPVADLRERLSTLMGRTVHPRDMAMATRPLRARPIREGDRVFRGYYCRELNMTLAIPEEQL